MAFSQSLIIYKTDQTSIDFELADIDSITFSVEALSKSLDISNWECITSEFVFETVSPGAGYLSSAMMD